MKQVLGGFWDQVFGREGWSDKIGKWQWVILQAVIPALIVLPFIIWMVIAFDDYTLKQAITFMMIFFPFTAIFNSGEWKRDQKRLSKGETTNDH